MSLIKREYYSSRKGLIQDSAIDTKLLKKLFLIVFNNLNNEGYFQKYFGIECTDGSINGELGWDIDTVLFINLKKDNLWPIYRHIEEYSEDDVFDMIEFLYDHCSEPTDKYYHNWNDCGWHVKESDDEKGKIVFRNNINSVLITYKEGYELSNEGEILMLPEKGFQNLLEAPIITNDTLNVEQRIQNAILKFRKVKSTEDERRDALRDLADVLEFIKKDIDKVLPNQDNKDLFNIANNFGIRHHNPKQKTQYDKAVWHSWIFYTYLATIHLVLRLKQNV